MMEITVGMLTISALIIMALVGGCLILKEVMLVWKINRILSEHVILIQMGLHETARIKIAEILKWKS